MSATPPSAPFIPAYLYYQYQDDDDLQALFKSFNNISQEYVNWFNTIQLPVYTGSQISGTLLDWVAQGLYGITRPILPPYLLGFEVGPFNTFALNSIAFNGYKFNEPPNFSALSDDDFKRVITWHFLKGDGKVFNIRWLKRRVMRFLTGINGTNPNIDQTYQISVTFGVGNQVNIRIISKIRKLIGGALLNSFAFNTTAFNAWETSVTYLTPFPEAPIFKQAVDAGILELPFQFYYVVSY